MNITYENTVLDRRTHGKSTSVLLKTRQNKETAPILCLPSGKLVVNTNVDDGKLPGTLDVSINDGDFKKIWVYDLQDELRPLLSTGDIEDISHITNAGIDARTIVTPSNMAASTVRFVNGYLFNFIAQILVETPEGFEPKKLKVLREFYTDVIGTLPTSAEDVSTIDVTGIGSNGTITGENKEWALHDILSIVDNLNLDSPNAPTFEIVNKPSKLTFRSSGDEDDIYNDVFVTNDYNEISVSSCSSLVPRVEYTCIPTVKTFIPTVMLEMSDGLAGYWMKIRLDLKRRRWNSNQISNETHYVYMAVTTKFREQDYRQHGIGGSFGVVELSENATPTQIARAMFSIAGTTDAQFEYSHTPLNGIGGFGFSANTCNLIASYDESSNQIVLAGMFDQNATVHAPTHPIGNGTIYGKRYVSATGCEAKITLEPINLNDGMPYYAKCYVTEQFGGPVVIQSCTILEEMAA